MDPEPLVSVVINCLNGEEYVREAIDTVYAQTYNNWEIIFWDNASTDGTGQIAQSYDERLKYYRGEETIPLGSARNEALSRCSGALIAFLDADDHWFSTKLSSQVRFFDDPSVGLVYTEVELFEKEPKGLQREWSAAEVRWSTVDFVSLLVDYDITLSSAVITRRALRCFPECFDERLKQAEDYDLFLRIASGYSVVRISEILAGYRIHRRMMSTKNIFLGSLEEEYILAKLVLDCPQLAEGHPGLIQKKRRNLAWRRGLGYVLRKDSHNARREFAPFVGIELRFSLVYAACLLGTAPIRAVWAWRTSRKMGIRYVS